MHTQEIRNLQYSFTLSVTLCTKFCNKQITFDKVIVKKLKNTDGPKFADPSMAAVSSY